MFRSDREQQICEEVGSHRIMVLRFVAFRRTKYLSNDEERKQIEGVLMEKVKHEYRESVNGVFTWKRLFMELSLIGELSFLFIKYL